MGVDDCNCRIFQQLPDGGVGTARVDKNGIHHHSVRIEASQRQGPVLQGWWYLVDKLRSRLGILGDEYCMACPIRVRNIMTDMVEEQDPFAKRSVGKADAAGKAGNAGHLHSDNAFEGELFSGKPNEAAVGGRIDSADCVAHAASFTDPLNSCFRWLAVKHL